MKRILPIVMALLLLAGCGGGEEPLAVSADEVAAEIVKQLAFEADLVPISADAVANWYTLDNSVASYSIYINASTVPAEEVAVLAGTTAGDIPALEAILARRRDYLEQMFENYQPDELLKIQNPVLVSKGNVAVMVLTDDANAAEVIEGILS